MSYQVLARKWRPKRFVEMVGQEHVLKALVNALDDDRLHHAYLFTGTRGVGKTSIARLFAKSLNCEQGVSSEPCGQCSACTEIAEGRFVDLIEVDAASRTKVEDTRELLDNVQYAPTHGRYKVYLIDEVHMLSGHSFNALLKTLEEPPPHIKFLLATTDPQKLPVTILSRCLQFNLKNLAAQRIVEHLSFVLKEEQIAADEASLWLLARSAEGSMRDALSLTDQAIAFGAGKVIESDVRAMLGTIDHRMVFELLDALIQGDGKRMMQIVAAMAEFAPDYSGVLAEMISILHRVALAQVVPDAIDNALGDKQQVHEIAARMRAEEVQLCYQIALTGRKDLPMVPQPREGLEMTLLRMLAFRPAGQRPIDLPPVERLDNPLQLSSGNRSEETQEETQESKASLNPREEPVSSTQLTPPPELATNEHIATNSSSANLSTATLSTALETHKATSAPIASEPPPWDEEPVPLNAYVDTADKEEGALKKFETGTVKTATAVAQASDSTATSSERLTQKSQEPVEIGKPGMGALDSSAELNTTQSSERQNTLPVSTISATELQRPDGVTNGGLAPEPVSELSALQLVHWLRMVELLGLSGMTESLARSLSLEKIAGNRLILHYTREQDALLTEVHRGRISDALQSYFAEPIGVEFVLGEQQRETPQRYRQRREAERRAAALAYLQADPKVQQIIETFSAEIVTTSVEPLNIE